KNCSILKSFLEVDVDEGQLSLKKIKRISDKIRKLSNANDIPEEIVVALFDFCTAKYLSIDQCVDERREDILQVLRTIITFLVKLPYNEHFLISCLKSSSWRLEQYLLAFDL